VTYQKEESRHRLGGGHLATATYHIPQVAGAGEKSLLLYHLCFRESSHISGGVVMDDSEKRAEKIAARREQIPRSYRGVYDRPVKGTSLRAATNAFCLERVCWQRKEIELCTDLGCPLWAVRPYRRSGNAHDGGFLGAQSKKSGQGELR
jgi:hypothetical protein